MIRNRVPCFKRGEILDSQLLENLRNTPYEFYSLAYHDYPNGIISGLDIYADKSKLTIKPGVVKFNNFYYRISKEEIIDIPLEDGDYILKMNFFPEKLVDLEKYYEYALEFELNLEEADNKSKLELARIKRREGAEIRNIDEFYGIEKEYNIVSEINKAQSTVSGVVISSSIMKMFAKKVLEKKETEAIDDSICINILSNNFSREALNLYILKKIGVDSVKSSNEELYRYLSKIYLNLKDNRKAKTSRIMTKNRMIVE